MGSSDQQIKANLSSIEADTKRVAGRTASASSPKEMKISKALHFSHSQNYPLSQPVMKLEGFTQCAGEAVYANDYPHTAEDVWCSWVVATEVNATIARIDPSEALVCIFLPSLVRLDRVRHTGRWWLVI